MTPGTTRLFPRARDAWLALGLAALLVGPAWVRGELAGSPGGELYGHAWVQWWVARAWPALPAGTDLALGAARWPVIDPLPTWLAGGLGRLAGPVAAWNLLTFGWVWGAALGGAALARAWAGSARVGAVGLALSSIWLGSLTSGLTEDGAVGLGAGAVAAFTVGLREGDRRIWLGAAGLGVTAACGLYLGWMAGLAAVGVLLADLVGRLRAGRSVRGPLLRGLLALGLAAGLMALVALPFRARLDGEGHHLGSPPRQHEPLWPLNPWRHADLASFLAPGPVERAGPDGGSGGAGSREGAPSAPSPSSPPGGGSHAAAPALVREHPTWPGLPVLALAPLGGGPGAWLGVAASAAASLGDELAWRGDVVGPNPAAPLLRRLPYAERLNHHARLWIVGQALLVVLAARGLRRLERRLDRPLAGWAVALLLVDTLLLSPLRLPLPGVPAASPSIYAALGTLPPGPVVVVGAAGPGIPPQKVFYDQRAHGRALLHDPNRPGPVAPVAGAVLVVLEPAVAAEVARRGEPAVRTEDGAAWWIE